MAGCSRCRLVSPNWRRNGENSSHRRWRCRGIYRGGVCARWASGSPGRTWRPCRGDGSQWHHRPRADTDLARTPRHGHRRLCDGWYCRCGFCLPQNLPTRCTVARLAVADRSTDRRCDPPKRHRCVCNSRCGHRRRTDARWARLLRTACRGTGRDPQWDRTGAAGIRPHPPDCAFCSRPRVAVSGEPGRHGCDVCA